MTVLRHVSLTQDQRDIVVGLFVKAMETVVAVVLVWVLASVVVGSIAIGRWLGGLG